MAVTRALSIEDGNLSSGGSIISSRDKAYKDIDLAFVRKPNGDLYKKTDAASVKQAVKNLLMTGRGQRPFQPLVGANLGSILFENANDLTTSQIDLAIRLAIENYEPRAEVLNIKVDNNLDRNQVFVGVEFRVKNTQELVTLETSISRLR
jgi:phage baseplate assembly protein W